MSGFLCTMVGASFTVTATTQVLRAKKTITANGNAQVSTAQSKFGGSSALFDGNTDALYITDYSGFTFTGDFTIEMFVRMTQYGEQTFLDMREGSGGVNTGAFLYRDSSSNLKFELGGSAILTDADPNIVTNQWEHIAVSRSGTTIRLFVNGTQTASATSSASGTPKNFYIGRNSFSATSGNTVGYIDEIRISNSARYTSAFTPSTTPFVNDDNTLLLIHANGTNASTVFTDDNGIGRSQTGISAIGNAQISTAQSKFGGASALFDGTGDYLIASPKVNLTQTDNFTIECWIRVPNISGEKVILSSFFNGGSYNGWSLEIENATVKWWNGSSWNSFNSSIAANTWYHIAIVSTAGSTKMYQEGVLQTTTSTLDGNFNNTTTPFYIGIIDGFSRAMNGWIDEIRVSSSVRYTANFTPSTTAFVNDANTLLLIHADGANASTVFTDDNAQLTVTPAATSVNEGSSLTFNVSTINTANQTLYYTLTNSGDFATSSGSFGLATNAGSFAVTPTADSTTEGAETFTASIRTGSTSGDIIATTSAVTINDTSVASVPATAFDGTGDYYEGTVSSSSGVADSLYTTFAGLIYKNVSGEHNLFEVQLGTASGNPGWSLNTWTDGGVLVTQTDNSGSDNANVFGTAGSVGSWMQFVLYVDWSNFANCKYFVNGVDQTSASLLNGPSFGERGVDNQAMNWTSATTVKLNIGGFFTNAGARDVNDWNGKIQYLLVKAGAGAPTISNYWDSASGKPKDLGTNGNATGINPNIYHYGNTSTFGVNNASNKFATYTLTKFGNTSDTSGTPYA